MENTWCRETAGYLPVVLLGSHRDRPVPPEFQGMFGALLLRSGEMGRDIQAELAHLGLPMPEQGFRLALFSLDDSSVANLSGRDRHNCRINMYLSLRDYLRERLADRWDGALVLMMGYLFGLIYQPEGETEPNRLCREAVDYAEKQLGFSVHVTISNRWVGVEKLETTYRMLQDFENSRSFYGDLAERVYEISDEAMVRIADGEQRTRFESSFFPAADRICGNVRAGDSQEAARYLRRQLLDIAENCLGMPYPTTLNLTVNRFLSLLQYRLAEQDLADWRYLSRMDFSRDLVASPNLAAFLAEGERIARLLVEHHRQRSMDKHDILMHDIRAYVEQNATDINMGLTLVAKEFRIKPREAAESFRAFYGESINDVIHRARVKKAKELLLTTDRPVQDIAQAVGYCSLATMYRAFTNVEGVAPGKLRQKKS